MNIIIIIKYVVPCYIHNIIYNILLTGTTYMTDWFSGVFSRVSNQTRLKNIIIIDFSIRAYTSGSVWV